VGGRIARPIRDEPSMTSTATTKIEQIGFKQAAQIASMPVSERLDFIAEGLPIIFESASSLMAAVRALDGLESHPRETEILEGHAVEECAKLLILVDLVRCPPWRMPAQIGRMMSWFYNHQARLICAEAQFWKPVSLGQLQTYINNSRSTYYLEGGISEFIMPNWALFQREATLYADVIGNEDAGRVWSSPLEPRPQRGLFELQAWRVADALDAFGLPSHKGVDVLQQTWGSVHFDDAVNWSETERLYDEMASAADKAGLLTNRLTKDHQRSLYDRWQMPMYELDFSPIRVTLEEMRDRREAAFWSEVY
jgi:hypothetical protein